MEDFRSSVRGNPQTDAFLNMLQLPHVVTTPYREDSRSDGQAHFGRLIPVQLLMKPIAPTPSNLEQSSVRDAHKIEDENKINLDDVKYEFDDENEIHLDDSGNEDKNEIDLDDL